MAIASRDWWCLLDAILKPRNTKRERRSEQLVCCQWYWSNASRSAFWISDIPVYHCIKFGKCGPRESTRLQNSGIEWCLEPNSPWHSNQYLARLHTSLFLHETAVLKSIEIMRFRRKFRVHRKYRVFTS